MSESDPSCERSFRHFEKICETLIIEVSSMKIFRSLKILQASFKLLRSSGSSFPETSFEPSIRPIEDKIRLTNDAPGISSEKIATAPGFLWATWLAKFKAKADFPIAGRAAKIIKSPGWNPFVMRSSSAYPVRMPLIPLEVLNISSSALTSATISREDLKSVPLLLRVTSITFSTFQVQL